MDTVISLLFLPFLFTSTALIQIVHAPPPPPPATPPNYYILALQWAPALCHVGECTGPAGRPTDEFRIHGLWPEPSTPLNCVEDQFKYYNVQSLEPDLTNFWPNLKNSSVSGNQRFWGYQWHKHGQCSRMNQHDYFETTLNLYKHRALLHQLKSVSVAPGGTYNANQIVSAFNGQYHVKPKIVCREGTNEIQELRFNLTADLRNYQSVTLYPIISCGKKVVMVRFPL